MLIATLENPPNLFNIINLEKAEKRFNFAWRLGNPNPQQIKNVTGYPNKVTLTVYRGLWRTLLEITPRITTRKKLRFIMRKSESHPSSLSKILSFVLLWDENRG